MFNEGKIKAIGVSNFLEIHLEKLLNVANVKPAVNQIEFHPWCHDDKLLEYCGNNGIIVEAYSSLGRADGKLWNNNDLLRIAQDNNVSIGQVLLRWGLQKGCVILPKSAKPDRILENSKLDFVLSDNEMAVLDGFHVNKSLLWDPNTFKV